ncbi:MAG: response regulator [Deltaproteobacteria bacterium]|nr:response regulator [Deltaproteobacteria bacterium]
MAEIIVLDDVQDASILISKILAKQGHNTHSFTEEEDAISFVKKNHVDLAVLDIKLKKMSGIEVLTILKQINPAIRVIMLTGYPSVETARDSLSQGADEYCVKPIDRDELEEKVAQVLEKKKEE